MGENEKVEITNPYWLWQLIRRNRHYRNAVDTLLEAFQGSPSFMNYYECLKHRDSYLAYYMDSENEAATGELDFYQQNLKMASMNTAANFNLLGGFHELFGVVDLDSPEYQNFYKDFGDILLFPLDYEIDEPFYGVLQAIWVLAPSRLAMSERSPLPSYFLKKDSLISYRSPNTINLTVDLRFSKKQISNYVEMILDQIGKDRTKTFDGAGSLQISHLITKHFNSSLKGKKDDYSNFRRKLDYFDRIEKNVARMRAFKESSFDLQTEDPQQISKSLGEIEKDIRELISAFDPAGEPLFPPGFGKGTI